MQLEEIAHVTRYPHIQARIQRATAGQLVNAIRGLATMVPALPRVDWSPDPKDNFLLALAQAGEADLLVSGDKRDGLALKRHEGTRILTAREALQVLGLEPEYSLLPSRDLDSLPNLAHMPVHG